MLQGSNRMLSKSIGVQPNPKGIPQEYNECFANLGKPKGKNESARIRSHAMSYGDREELQGSVEMLSKSIKVQPNPKGIPLEDNECYGDLGKPDGNQCIWTYPVSFGTL